MASVPQYLQWGVVQISVPNLVVIGLMILVFVLSVVVPYPRGRQGGRGER
ncbi:MAG TPA: hypothetical protein VHN99_08080 [Deinococcales bacterium]|nr:hypothetical protein [Deinococcales bacterium]